MSFVMIKRELISDKNINANEYRVYTYLLMMYNEEKGYAFPSIDVIADKTNLSQSTVKRCIKKLEKLGYLEVSKRKGLAGNFNIYSNLKHLVNKKENKSEKEEAKSKIITIIEEEDTNEEVLNFSNIEELDTKSNNKQKELDNHKNVRLARSVTDIDKSNFAKVVLSIAEERLVREAIRNFKNKKGKNATFLITILIDEYFKNGIKLPIKMLNLLRKGLRNPFLEQPA